MNQAPLDSEFDANVPSSLLDPKTKGLANQIIVYINVSIKEILLVRNLLIVLSVYTVIGLFLTFSFNDELLFYPGKLELVIISLLYSGCLLNFQNNPKLSCIAGVSIFLLVQVYFHLIGFREIWSWLIVKIPILYIFIQGINGCIKIEKDTTKLIDYGIPHDQIHAIKKLKEIPLLK